MHGFPGYAAGEPVPTLLQILNGERPANTPPVRVDTIPGTVHGYSGGGVTVEQQLMMDSTGEQFPSLMREIVLNKVGMTDSTYEQPLPSPLASLAAAGTDSCGNTIPGKWHTYPEMAAAGLWTTPTDLAKFADDIALSVHARSNLVLSESMAQEMLKPQIENVGLGFFLGGNKNPGQFRHGGSDEGFEAEFIMNADSGQGVAIMTNSANGSALAELLVESVAREYKWNYIPPQRSAVNLLRLIANAKGVRAALGTYSEIKTASIVSVKRAASSEG